MHGTRHSTGQNKTQIKKKKSPLVGVLNLGSGHTQEREDGEGLQIEERVLQGSHFPNGREPLAGRQGSTYPPSNHQQERH